MTNNLGEIILFAGDFQIAKYARCAGQLLPINQYAPLYSILGTRFGGDGRTTFGLPDLRGKTLVGNDPDNTAFMVGAKGGANSYTLNSENMPPIPFMVNSGSANQSTATDGASIASPGKSVNGNFEPTSGYNTATPNKTINTGGGSATKVNNMQPFVQMEYLICIDGDYVH
ncbi:MAG: tail fiber protein [Gilvibacter sp.]